MFNLFANKVKTTVIEELDENELKEFCKKNEGETNVILSQNIKLGHNSQSTFRNTNVICIGNSGSGKTRQFVIPNIIACNANYVITDHRNEIFDACEETLRNNGYEIEVIDYTKMDVSDLTDASKILNGADFSKLNGGKVAIFIEMFASAMSPNVNGLINKAYETVRDKREYVEERRQVTFVLDEFPSIGAVGEIPGLAKIMAACRTYRVNFIITVQAVEQLKEMYGENYNEIIANCDSIVMMKSWLWTPDDLEMIKSEEVVEKLKNIDDDECMVMVREYKPMIDKKIAIA